MAKRRNMHLHARPSTFKHAATLRAQMTPAEILLWEHLRERKMEGIRFRRQHPFSKYIGDFYAHSIKLTIEADGAYHDNPTQQMYDADRTENLQQHRIHVLRFSNHDILHNLPEVLDTIRKKIFELKKTKIKKA